MVWIVYKTTCLINNKIYIGVHKLENLDVDDGYIGNGISRRCTHNIHHPKFPFHYAVQKYGVENFKRETLFVFDNPEKAYEKEASIVTPEFINQDTNYNYALGGGRSKPTKGKVYQFDLDGKFVNIYECIKDASIATGISESAIATSIRKLKARREFLWSFNSEIDPNAYYIKRLHTYNVYDSNYRLVDTFTKRADMLNKYGFDGANVSRAIKRNIKINGYYITYNEIK